MHKGKLLALDLLLRVLSNPMHDWAHVRPLFAGELRQPLCVALLRNCMSPYDQVCWVLSGSFYFPLVFLWPLSSHCLACQVHCCA